MEVPKHLVGLPVTPHSPVLDTWAGGKGLSSLRRTTETHLGASIHAVARPQKLSCLHPTKQSISGHRGAMKTFGLGNITHPVP